MSRVPCRVSSFECRNKLFCRCSWEPSATGVKVLGLGSGPTDCARHPRARHARMAVIPQRFPFQWLCGWPQEPQQQPKTKNANTNTNTRKENNHKTATETANSNNDDNNESEILHKDRGGGNGGGGGGSYTLDQPSARPSPSRLAMLMLLSHSPAKPRKRQLAATAAMQRRRWQTKLSEIWVKEMPNDRLEPL